MNIVDLVADALVHGIQAEVKGLDESRARYVVNCALETRLPGGSSMYGMDGKGLFARAYNDNTPEVLAAHFRWICMPVINGSRQRVNRHPEFFLKCKQLGLGITTFDWKPKFDNFADGLEDAIHFSASVGATVYVLNAEVEFFNQPNAAADFVHLARQFCDAAGIRLGFTSYGMPTGIPAFPWSPFTKGTDVSIPQAYDADFALNPNYGAHAEAAYRALGAPRISLGRSFFRNDPPNTTHARWMHTDELAAHLATTPADATSVVFWPLAGAIPAPLLVQLDKWNLGGGVAGSSVREVLTNLTPFGKILKP